MSSRKGGWTCWPSSSAHAAPPRHALHPTLLRFSPPPHPTLTATFCCRKVYEMRADGISPDVRHFASTDDEYLEELRQACTRRGLRID